MPAVVWSVVTVEDDDPIAAICCAWTVDGQDDSIAMEMTRDRKRAIGGRVVLAGADAVRQQQHRRGARWRGRRSSPELEPGPIEAFAEDGHAAQRCCREEMSIVPMLVELSDVGGGTVGMGMGLDSPKTLYSTS